MYGNQSPRFSSVPDADVSLGDDAVKFAADAGLFLDPWQQTVLRGSLGMVKGGKWSARDVGLLVPRQNGKGSILEARELFGMFVLGEKLIIHSAHKFDTSQEHFLRMRHLIEANPDLDRHVEAVYTGNGKEAIILRNGSRLKFKARTISGSGRGFSADLLVLDEAMYLPDQSLAAMLPTLATRPNPQVWYTSSAGEPESTALWRIVRRGREGSPRLAFYEWGCPSGCDPADRENWRNANPGRVLEEALEADFESLTPEDFAREHLGIWDDAAKVGLFPSGTWETATDSRSRINGMVSFAVEVAEDRSWSCIAAAGDTPAGLHVEAIDYRPGTSWIVARMVELASRHVAANVIVRPGSGAGALIADMQAANLRVVKASAQDYAQACGMFYDAVVEGSLRHLGQPELDMSVSGAIKRTAADAFVWDQRKSTLDISPLGACTLAAWGHKVHGAIDVAEAVW